eukprot:14162909-Ditylum_brightwellii.AAC.1
MQSTAQELNYGASITNNTETETYRMHDGKSVTYQCPPQRSSSQPFKEGTCGTRKGHGAGKGGPKKTQKNKKGTYNFCHPLLLDVWDKNGPQHMSANGKNPEDGQQREVSLFNCLGGSMKGIGSCYLHA